MTRFQCGLIKTSTIRNVLEKITQAAIARDVARKLEIIFEEKEF